jgi:hypothetical protein
MSPAVQPQRTGETRAYWTVNQIAELLSLHPTTITRMFQDEPGVLKLNQKRLLRGRPHVTLRIPNALLERKIRELTQ